MKSLPTAKTISSARSHTHELYRLKNDGTIPLSVASIDKDTHGSAGRKCPQSASKPLRIHKVFSAAFSLPEEHFCSGRTATHRTALYFRGIFVLLDAGGLSPTKEKRAKSSEKAGCPTCVPLLIDANNILYHVRQEGKPTGFRPSGLTFSPGGITLYRINSGTRCRRNSI